MPRLASAARRRFAGVAIHSAILPTEWSQGPARAKAAYERVSPDVSIHFGVSGRAEGFVIERRGINVCLKTEDGAGHLPPLAVLDPEGSKRRAVTLPVAGIVARLKRMGLPVATSDDGGRIFAMRFCIKVWGLARGWRGLCICRLRWQMGARRGR